MTGRTVTFSDQVDGWFHGYSEVVGTIASVVPAADRIQPYYVIRFEPVLELQESGASTPSGLILNRYSHAVIRSRWQDQDIGPDGDLGPCGACASAERSTRNQRPSRDVEYATLGLLCRQKPETCVAIVFDGDASEALARLASRGHVWVVTSPSNERAVQAYWQNPVPPFSVTMFNEVDVTAFALERLGIVGVVEEHRWDYSDTHEYPILEVVGLPLDVAAADYLRTFGFTRFEGRSNDFVAHRPPRPHEFP